MNVVEQAYLNGASDIFKQAGLSEEDAAAMVKSAALLPHPPDQSRIANGAHSGIIGRLLHWLGNKSERVNNATNYVMHGAFTPFKFDGAYDPNKKYTLSLKDMMNPFAYGPPV